VNVKGLLFTVQKALPLLPDGASIILNASIVGSKGLAANSVYSASKAAVRSFARTWTTDLRQRRIRVNAVSPGATDTPGLSDLLASGDAGRERLQTLSISVPLGRLGTPDEVQPDRVAGREPREDPGDHAGHGRAGAAVRAGVHRGGLLGVPRQGQDSPHELLNSFRRANDVGIRGFIGRRP